MAKNFSTVLDAVRAAGATKLHELESAFAEDSSWLQMRCSGVAEQIGQLQKPAAMPKRRGRPPRVPKVRSRLCLPAGCIHVPARSVTRHRGWCPLA